MERRDGCPQRSWEIGGASRRLVKQIRRAPECCGHRLGARQLNTLSSGSIAENQSPIKNSG